MAGWTCYDGENIEWEGTLKANKFKGDGSELSGISAGHAAVTVTDGTTINFTLTAQDITAETIDSAINHNSLLNYAANQHVVLPNTITNVLSDHNLAAHTALGLFDASSDVDHNSTTNFSANKHIDHTAVSISAGTGLTGGGDISATRTLSVTGLTTAEIAAATLVTEADTIAANDNDTTLPTSAAVKDYADKKIKEIFVYPTAENPATDLVGFFSTTGLVNTPELCYFNFYLPVDFNALTSVSIAIIPDATETIQYDLIAEWGANGEDYATNLSQALNNQTLAVVTDQIAELTCTALFTSGFQLGGVPAAGDYVGLKIASDTTQIRVFGCRVRYT